MRLSINFNGSEGLDWIVPIYLLIWVSFIAVVLLRNDIEPVERLIWLVTVIFVPVFGMLFYFFLVPGRNGMRDRRLTDELSRGASGRKVNLQSDVAGTPWQDDPGHTA